MSPSYGEQGSDLGPSKYSLRALNSIRIKIFRTIGAKRRTSVSELRSWLCTKSVRANWRAGAILRLPIDHTADVFHTYGTDDIFRRPVSQDFKKCNLFVEIRGGEFDQDVGYWLDAGRAAGTVCG